jgi:hypothetical protein
MGIFVNADESGLLELFEKNAQEVIAKIIENQDSIIRDYNKMFSLTRQEVERKWGKPLNHLTLVWAMSHAIGKRNQEVWSLNVKKGETKKFSAMTMIHDRSCRTALEIICLLRAGLPDGAQARARTLHELFVVSTLLKDNDAKLSEKYLDHAIIDTYKGIKDLRKDTSHNASIDEEFNKQKGIVKELRAKYGERFCKDYGWASDIIPGTGRISFVDLEIKAESSVNYRPFYRSASHDVHASSSGYSAWLGTNRMLAAGPCVDGFAVPGSAAAIYIASITNNVIDAAKTAELTKAGFTLMEFSGMTSDEFLEISP